VWVAKAAVNLRKSRVATPDVLSHSIDTAAQQKFQLSLTVPSRAGTDRADFVLLRNCPLLALLELPVTSEPAGIVNLDRTTADVHGFSGAPPPDVFLELIVRLLHSADRLYPGALEVLNRLRSGGRP